MKVKSGLARGQVVQRATAGSGRGVARLVLELDGVDGPLLVEVIRLADGEVVAHRQFKRPPGRLTIPRVPAGGPYRLVLSDARDRLVVEPFWVGDVWVLAGQSNMQGIGDMSGATAPDERVRALDMSGRWVQAKDPLHVLRASVDFAHHRGGQVRGAEARRLRTEAEKGVGPGLTFGRSMVRETGVPQGLLPCAHGGTSMTQWSPTLLDQGGSSLYGAMIRTVRSTGYAVAGVLWYQGETDCSSGDAAKYTRRMERLIDRIRSDLGQPNLPFHLCQLCRVALSGAGTPWESVREHQRKLPGRVRWVTTTSTIDLPMDDHIHVSATGHHRLGHRLARAALAAGSEELPHLLDMELADRPDVVPLAPAALTIRMGGVVGGLQSQGRPTGFSIRSAEGQRLDIVYRTRLHGDEVVLELSQRPPPGSTLTYGAGANPYANITDARDLALPAFGPHEVEPAVRLGAFARHFRTTAFASGALPLSALRRPQTADLVRRLKVDPGGFVNLHDEWEGRPGQMGFACRLRVPKSQRLELRLGYDGPVKLWIGRRLVYSDHNGRDPAFPDQAIISTRLSAGVHEVALALDNNGGESWGFLLRCAVSLRTSGALPKFVPFPSK